MIFKILQRTEKPGCMTCFSWEAAISIRKPCLTVSISTDYSEIPVEKAMEPLEVWNVGVGIEALKANNNCS